MGQEEKKIGDEKWSNWKEGGESEISTAEKELASNNCNSWSKGGVLSTSAGQESRGGTAMFGVAAMLCPVPAGESRVSVVIPAQGSSCDVRSARGILTDRIWVA